MQQVGPLFGIAARAEDERVYLPPTFPLVEFDEAMAEVAAGGTRSFMHWNGLVSRAAEQVLLGWSGKFGREVVVGTRQYDGKWPLPSLLRLEALYLAGGAPINESLEPMMALEQWRLAHDNVDINDRWGVVEALIEGERVPAQLLPLEAGAVGAALHAGRVVSFSLRGLIWSEVSFRDLTAQAAAAYSRDPLQPAER